MESYIKELENGGTMVKLSATDTMEEILKKVVQVRPSDQQVAWQELEFIAFVHFGLNTFTDREWGEGTEPLDLFNPTSLDADQWVKAIRDAEMKAIVLTCKHHSGFCLWPSQYTDYTVQNTAWRNGQGDVVRDVAEACKKYGVKFAVYLSPWDRHEPSYGDSPAYNTYYKRQVTELFTNYGDVIDLWLDGACGEGPNGKQQTYDWRGIYETVRTLQPNATVSCMGPDTRWCGNEAGSCRENEWSPLPMPGLEGIDAHLSEASAYSFCNHNYTLATKEDLGGRETLKKHAANGDWVTWYPAQVDISVRPGWFYHDREDDMVKSLKLLMDMYYQSVGGNAQLLLNVPVMPNGLFHQTDVTRLKQIGEVIRATFKHNLVEEGSIETYECDGNTFVEISFEEPVTFNTLMIQEEIKQGQRVEAFVVEVEENNGWTTLGAGTVIGYKKLMRLSEEDFITASKLRIQITQTRAVPVIKQIGLYKAPILVAEPNITRSEEGVVSITSRIKADIYYTTDGSVPTQESARYTQSFDLPYGGIVKAVAYYVEENPDFYVEENVVATKTFGVNKKHWRVTASSGNEAAGFASENILSEDATCYLKTTSNPYWVELDMGEELTLSGFSFMPVADGYDFNYNVSTYSLYTSMDGEHWEAQKQEDAFDNIYHNPILQVVPFTSSCNARYLRFEIHSSIQSSEISVMRELSVMLAK
ncbi:MAG: alpha-L-fucosidase [Cellulosilyticaceae bacterium]